ncbi:RnfABCDGE type electron transport complex subunit D [Rhodovulum tesquicola]|uniref:RnfABCDGE type electron transport complex subunit D n=1 Tax=Rhodovulum tesquicola TaxID=540254 RepID=UPI00209719D3|nr:RnfABCDGE type electron transport complex subunit D [Rhodovulum tesquicola]MCO8144594.1 RnfABCDGE type electron transport complex subunit D [Rhodovulum tesquicola]
MTAPILVSGPHIHSRFNVSRTMMAVMVCLSPATGFGLLHFGWPAVFLFLVTIVAALLFEVLCLALAGKPILRFATDGSAILTGWIVALTLPPWAPWWVGVTAAGLAIVIGKHVFGGLGQNLFNPAMVARAMLLVALPVQMTVWVDPVLGGPGGLGFQQALAVTFGGDIGIDAVSSASVLSHVQSQLDAGQPMQAILAEIGNIHDQFFGYVPGSLGETSAFLLLLGGVGLILMRVITVVIPLSVLGSVAVLSGAAWGIAPDSFPPPQVHLASGSLMFCAFFIATDYVTSPVTGLGKMIYGIGIGALIFIIRSWGAFPEGVAFAVLLMNACTPLIDEYVRPRIFGRTRAGKPIELGGKP